MELFIGVGLVVLIGMMGFSLWRAAGYALGAGAVPPKVEDIPQTCAGCTEVALGVAEVRGEIDNLKLAVSQGIEHVDRVESRIRGTIKRARKELQEHGVEAPGLEAEVATLSLGDGDRVEEPPVQLMPPSVDAAESSIPGVSQEQLRRVRGR